MDAPFIVFCVFMFVDGATGATAGAETVTEDSAGVEFFANAAAGVGIVATAGVGIDAAAGVGIVAATGVGIVAAAGVRIVADAGAEIVVESTVAIGLDGMHSP